VAGTGSYDETFELSTIFVEKTVNVRSSLPTLHLDPQIAHFRICIVL
jgi:hypothetical protein